MKKILMAIVAVAAVAMAGTAMAGDSAQVTVSATVTGTCKFISGGTVSFTLDPSAGGLVTGTVTQPTLWCTKGTLYTITDDNGANKSGTTYRMRRGLTADYIPYTFSYTGTGTGEGKTFAPALAMNISATVSETDYINATAGAYNDTVTLTIGP